MEKFTYQSALGPITIVAMNARILHIVFNYKRTFPTADEIETPVIKKTWYQLQEYFAGRRVHFDIPICFIGSEFVNPVREIVQQIPYGKTLTYTDIARILGNPNYARAIANYLCSNYVPILLPCHRVIGTRGNIGNYTGSQEIKKALLAMEKKYYNDRKNA